MQNKSKTLRLALALSLGAGWGAAAREGPPVEEGRRFWAFQPPATPAVPEVAMGAWPDGDIDRFVLAGLEAQGLAPAPPASRRTLARRLYFDLIGLPPPPAEIDRFVADPGSDAYGDLVDRLLASPHFGERWGRHWLDVARYSESTGGGRDMKLPDAWRYRDYVIDAFNADKPFDRFVTEQIAGDLLGPTDARGRREALTATGFLALGPSNYENQDKEQLRMDVVDEQVDTVGRAFMAMTLGCARCHDHFFDPVPTRDYYALAGIFRSTKTLEHANVSSWIKTPLPAVSPEEKRQEEQRRQWDERRSALRAEIAKLKAGRGGGSKAGQRPPGIVVDDDDAVFEGRWTTSTVVPGFFGRRYLHDGARRGPHSATFSCVLPEAGEYEVRVSYTHGANRAPEVEVRVAHADGESTSTLNQRRPPGARGFTAVGRYRFDAQSEATVTISNARPGSGHVIADAVAFVPTTPRGDIPQPGRDGAARDGAAALAKLEADLKALDKARPPGAPLAMSVTDEAAPADYHINIGGDPHKLGEPVPRGFLSVASKPGAPGGAIAGGGSGRLELAAWLTSPEHPLTARVFANRTWYWLTGRGIVATVDNFGTTGEPPADPALLDHLAAEFVAGGWSVKSLVRKIVMSKTYRQSAATGDGAGLAGFAARRVDAESLRDAMLSVSGELEAGAASPGGDFGSRAGRPLRSIYLPVSRNSIPEILEVFDFPDPNLSSGLRTSNNLPTQALLLMNHPWVIARAKAAGERWRAQTGDDVKAGVSLAYRTTYGRAPDPAEVELALEFLGPSPDEKAWTAFQQTLFASISFRYID